MNLRHVSLALVLLASACGDEQVSTSPAPDLRRQLAALTPTAYTVTRLERGGAAVAKIGAHETRCPDGVSRPVCELASIDLARVDMTPEEEAFARTQIDQGKAILVGKLGRTDDTGARLVVSEIWVRRAASATLDPVRAQAENVFVLRDVHEACASGDACAWLRAEPLDGSRPSHLGDLDLSLLGGNLEPAEKDAIARGRVMAHGAAIGAAFVAASIYLPFPEVLGSAHELQ